MHEIHKLQCYEQSVVYVLYKTFFVITQVYNNPFYNFRFYRFKYAKSLCVLYTNTYVCIYCIGMCLFTNNKKALTHSSTSTPLPPYTFWQEGQLMYLFFFRFFQIESQEKKSSAQNHYFVYLPIFFHGLMCISFIVLFMR